MKTLSQSDAGNTKIVNLVNGTASTDAAAYGQIPSLPLSIANGGTGSGTQPFVDLTAAQSVGGVKTFTSAVAPSAGVTPISTGFNSFATGGMPNLINQTGGFNVTMVAGTIYYAAMFVPINITVSGLIFTYGTTAGTDKWIGILYDSAGTKLGNSPTAGISVFSGSNGKQKFTFTGGSGAVAITGPAVYFVGLQSNGTTAKFLAFSNATEGFATGSVTGSFGTLTLGTPASTYTINLGPYSTTY